MNCETYLSMLSTLPVDELNYGEARAHAATCRDCDRVSRVVAERERSMLMAFGELYPPTPAAPMATRALELSRRRRVAVYYKIGLGVVTVATLFSVFVARRIVPSPSARVTDAFPLRCLSPEQLSAMLLPFSQQVTMQVQPNTPDVITISAPELEMREVRALIDRYDTPANPQCGAPITPPSVMKTP